MFEIDELFHLALHASSTGQHHICMTYLKELLQRKPDHAPAVYLLAVQHAELGLVDRAVRGLEAALDIDAGLDMARLQLGLLLLNANRNEEAKERFAPLRACKDSALRLCAEAMISLIDGDERAAREKLTLGLAEPTRVAALGELMQRLLAGLAARSEAAAPPHGLDATGAGLGAYAQAGR